jgi:hypothetical protein
MLYIGTPSGPAIRAAMTAGDLGCITTPAQGNRVPEHAWWAADNGKFGKGWPGPAAWWRWVNRQVRNYGAARCLWVLAPDVPFDAAATLAESRPWLARIRDLGCPAAFAAQDGCEHGLIPWGEFAVLFIAGSTEWKTSSAAEALSREARSRGVRVHMGRVNTRNRLRTAEWFGCDSCDGTTFTRGGDRNWHQLAAWMAALDRQPSLGAAPRFAVIEKLEILGDKSVGWRVDYR